MATNKTLAPTNVTISIPAMTDQPDAAVFSNCIDKEADAINALNSQISPLPRIAVISWEPTGADASVTAGTAVTIATVTDIIPSGAAAKGVIKYSSYGASNYDYDGSLMLVGGYVKYMPKITQGSIHVYGAIIYTV